MRSHTIATYVPDHPGAYVGNGLIGLIVPLSPFLSGEFRVSGCTEATEEYNSECIATLPYPVALRCRVNDRALLDHASAFRSQTYRFSCGEIQTELCYRVPGGTIAVSDLLFCSRSNPATVVRRLVVRADTSCVVALDAYVDPRGARGTMTEAYGKNPDVHGAVRWLTAGNSSSAGIAFHVIADAPRVVSVVKPEMATVRVTSELRSGEALTVVQIAAGIPERLHAEPHWQALRLVRSAVWRGFDTLREMNQGAWDELWRGRVRLVGAGEAWQDVSDAAFFYLHSSAHQAAPCSIPPYGLSSSGYGGHVFWDTETFMFPVILLTAPDTAEALLRYRVDRLDAARTNATLSGYKGAMFPWESGVTGCDLTPIHAPTSEEHHITLDVAFACLQYAYAAGNAEFIRTSLWPLLDAVCRWIVSRVEQTARGYEIRNVVGADESFVNVHNNSYTNIAAKIVLKETAGLALGVGIDADLALWRRVADDLFVPVDPALGIIMKHDAYRYEGGPCIPEPLAAFFPLTYSHTDPEVERATYDYYLELANTALHLPMLSSLFGVCAARRGKRALSLEHFSKGILDFVCEPYSSFLECRENDQPVFLTNPAGFLTACLYGLTGIQLDSGEPCQWGRYPIVMPDGWAGIEVERVWIRGRPATLTARHGDSAATIEWLD